MKNRWLIPFSVIAAVGALGGFLVYAATQNWFDGSPAQCFLENAYFCEELRPGLVKQPSNTFSNLAFVFIGLGCAWHAMRNHKADGGRMQSTVFYPALFATALALLGPGSMAMHASMTNWGGKVDVISMELFMGVAAAIGLSRRFKWSHGGFLAGAALIVGAGVALKWFHHVIRTEVSFGVVVALFVFNETIPGEDPATRLPDKTWLKRGAFCFFAAFGVWLGCRTQDGPWCYPQSLIQGHAIWHILTAMGAGCLYPYFLQERPFQPAPAAAPAAEPA
jgi:hypothetical protein